MKYLYLTLIILVISACSSKKDVLLMQDFTEFSQKTPKKFDYKVKPDDILNIKVTSQLSDAALPYNNYVTPSLGASIDILRVEGYLVSAEGNIKYPYLGSINVFGMTTSEIEDHIYNLLLNSGQLTDHAVFVKVINSSITILGEVNVPGKYYYSENSININEALGLAGDLTINAQRDNIKLIREKNDLKSIHEIDLTSVSYIESDFYNLQNGDIIVVNPNITRVKNAGIIGNSGTLLSLLSFILSSLILITNR